VLPLALDDFAFDLGSLDFSGMSREDVLAALVEAAQRAADDGGDDVGFSVSCAGSLCSEVHFYSPDQARDHRGRWTAGGGSGGGGTTAEERASARESRHADARAAVAKFLSGKGSPTKAEVAAVAEHLAGMTVKQLQGLRQEHGLKDPRLLKADLVTALHGYFVARRGKAEAEKAGGEAGGGDKPVAGKLHDGTRLSADPALTVRGWPSETTLGELKTLAKQKLGDKYRGVVVRQYGGGKQIEVLATKHGYHGVSESRAMVYQLPDTPAKSAEPHPLDVAAAGRPGFKAVKPIVGGDKAYEHTPTGFRVESHGPLHTVYSPGLSREGTHADAGAAVKAAEGPHGKEMIGDAGEIQKAHRAQAGANLRGKAADPEAHVRDVVAAVTKHGGEYNLADLAHVRGELGHLSRAEQDRAIDEARRRGHLYGSAYEGRHGLSAAQQAAALEEPGGRRVGFLSLRHPGAAAAPAPAAGAAGGAAPTHAELLDAMRKVEPQAAHGAMVSLRDLRRSLPGVSKEGFDKAVLSLGRAGKIDLHEHDLPSSLTPAQRADLVAGEGGRHYVGAVIRAGAGAPAASPAPAPPAPAAPADHPLLRAMAAHDAQFPHGAMVSFKELRPSTGLSKGEFDRQVLDLAGRGVLALHRDNRPGFADAAELRTRVSEGGTHFVGASLHAGTPEGREAAARLLGGDDERRRRRRGATFSVASALPPDQAALARDRRAALEWAERVNARRRTPAGVSP
jgi:hypothetical protein